MPQKNSKKETKRTCIVTKQKTSPQNLFRFTVQEGVLRFDSPDSGFKSSGRGGYVMRDKKVVENLPRLKGKIKYLLRVEGDLLIPAEEIEKAKRWC